MFEIDDFNDDDILVEFRDELDKQSNYMLNYCCEPT